VEVVVLVEITAATLIIGLVELEVAAMEDTPFLAQILRLETIIRVVEAVVGILHRTQLPVRVVLVLLLLDGSFNNR
jgi:hypothetical protein